MRENSFLAKDVDFRELAARIRNYNGAKLEIIVRSIILFALMQKINMDHLTKSLDDKNISHHG